MHCSNITANFFYKKIPIYFYHIYHSLPGKISGNNIF